MVAWISVRPWPVRSSRNFGVAERDSGHSRVPAPPAGTIAQSRSTGRSRGLSVLGMSGILPKWSGERRHEPSPTCSPPGSAPTPGSRWSRRTTTRPVSAPSCR